MRADALRWLQVAEVRVAAEVELVKVTMVAVAMAMVAMAVAARALRGGAVVAESNARLRCMC